MTGPLTSLGARIPLEAGRELAFLARSRWAAQDRGPVYVTEAEMDELVASLPLDQRDLPPGLATLFGVPVEIDDTRAAAQVAEVLAGPAPRPMDWET